MKTVATVLHGLLDLASPIVFCGFIAAVAVVLLTGGV